MLTAILQTFLGCVSYDQHLRLVYPPHLVPANEQGQKPIPSPALGLLVGIGLSLGTTQRFLFPAVSQTFGMPHYPLASCRSKSALFQPCCEDY